MEGLLVAVSVAAVLYVANMLTENQAEFWRVAAGSPVCDQHAKGSSRSVLSQSLQMQVKMKHLSGYVWLQVHDTVPDMSRSCKQQSGSYSSQMV